MAMTKLGGGFQSFAIQIPLIQICTRLDLLTNKRVASPPAKASRDATSGPARKGKPAGGKLELVGEGGQLAVRLPPPPGDVPDVIVWEDRFFLRCPDGRYREGRGYVAPRATAKPASKRKRGKASG
jgi:hypothetical protein